MNEALSVHQMEEFSSMLMPVQGPRSWDDNEAWANFLRRDVSGTSRHFAWQIIDCRFPMQSSRLESYAYVLNAHLQSANSELR